MAPRPNPMAPGPASMAPGASAPQAMPPGPAGMAPGPGAMRPGPAAPVQQAIAPGAGAKRPGDNSSPPDAKRMRGPDGTVAQGGIMLPAAAAGAVATQPGATKQVLETATAVLAAALTKLQQQTQNLAQPGQTGGSQPGGRQADDVPPNDDHSMLPVRGLLLAMKAAGLSDQFKLDKDTIAALQVGNKQLHVPARGCCFVRPCSGKDAVRLGGGVAIVSVEQRRPLRISRTPTRSRAGVLHGMDHERSAAGLRCRQAAQVGRGAQGAGHCAAPGAGLQPVRSGLWRRRPGSSPAACLPPHQRL
jgi:hypothetical protein